MHDEDQEKTQDPTQKRLDEAFQEGNFAKAAEISVVFVLLGALSVIGLQLHRQATTLGHFASSWLGHLDEQTLNIDAVTWGIKTGILDMSYAIGPLMAACVAGAICAGGLQTGFRLTLGAFSLKTSRLDITQGFKRLFSSDNLATIGLEGLKFTVVGLILYGGVQQVLQDPIFSLTTPLSYIGIFMEETFFSLMKRLILALGVLAALHYFYQRHKTYQNLRMSTQELKDEQRQSQLDPKLKAAQKRLALQLMQKQLLSQVPVADVVVTNPTHFAVAMKYERGKDKAPVVLAKGKNSLAQYIKKIAQEHGVPMTENKLAARLLYALGTVGKPIPVELYRIVADILTLVYKQHKYYFYRLKSRRSIHEPDKVLGSSGPKKP